MHEDVEPAFDVRPAESQRGHVTNQALNVWTSLEPTRPLGSKGRGALAVHCRDSVNL